MPNNCASTKTVMMFSKPGIISRWDDDYCEYKLVAPVNLIRSERNDGDKMFLPVEYGAAVNIISHITITRFMARQRMEETFSRWITNICLLHCGFTLKKDLFYVKSPGYIYLKPGKENPFQQLADSLIILNSYLESNNCPPLKFESPRIYMAGHFPESINENALINYENKNFLDSFTIEKLQLLRSDAMMNFNIVNNFTLLLPLPVHE